MTRLEMLKRTVRGEGVTVHVGSHRTRGNNTGEMLAFIRRCRTPAPEGVRTCRRCGCWELDACHRPLVGPCWWVEDDLCSHCDPGSA